MYTYSHPHPAVTTDVVVFTIRDGALQVLLVRRAEAPYKGAWALPGGFVGIDEDLEAAARRELREETGIEGVYLEQLYTFGKPDRDPRERVITVAYYALIPSDRLELQAATDAVDARWFAWARPPRLAFDHAQILAMAHERLKAKLDYSTIAFQFLPSEFTLSELQAVYEMVLGEPLDKRNFRKRIHTFGALRETRRTKREGAHRPAKLYRLAVPRRVEIIK
jgi:8-oxo-dGTP diphosphatase